MAKIEIQDECLSPNIYIWFDYKGPNPWSVAKKIADSARMFFHLGASQFYHDRLNWDISGDPITFYSMWKFEKDFSAHVKQWVYLRVQGEKSKADGSGKFTMRMNSILCTTFEGWGIFLKPLYYIYSYLFFNRIKRKFIESCRQETIGFKNEIKEHFNVRVTEGPPVQAIVG